MIDTLREIRYFGGFDEKKLNELSKICMFKKLSQGEILFYEGDVPKYIYYLKKGYLRVLKNQGDLKQLFINTMNPGMLVAEVTMFENMNYPATTEAIGDCEVLMIDLAVFKKDFLNDVGMLQEMIKSLSIKVKYLMHSLEVETSLSTDLKIGRYLLEHQREISKIKHKDIAFELNTTSETVSRVLKKFVQKGLLEKTNPIVIKNANAIKVLCN